MPAAVSTPGTQVAPHARAAIGSVTLLEACPDQRYQLQIFATAPGLPLVRPAGAFYFYFDVSAAAPNEADPGTAFAKRLLEDKGVAVVPGAAFRTPEWVRASYAAPQADVVEGIKRAVALWREMQD